MNTKKFKSDLKVCILCGGKGTRLGSLTKNIPKPLIPINGKPIISYIIDHIKNAGIKDVIIASGYKSDKMFDYFSSNFIYSTEQPLHSDYIHFGSVPELFLTGVWIALEDIHPDSGPLTITPKSHNLEIVDLDTLGLDVPKSNKQLKENYTI